MQIRRAEPADVLAVARVHVRSWQVAFRGLLPDVYLDGLRAEERASKYDFASTDPRKPQTIVAIQFHTIVGFVTTALAHEAGVADLGALNALYVDPVFWGRGIGTTLIATARARLMEQGFSRACLWVLDGNARADRFYRNDGWLPDGVRRTETVWEITINETRYQRAL